MTINTWKLFGIEDGVEEIQERRFCHRVNGFSFVGPREKRVFFEGRNHACEVVNGFDSAKTWLWDQPDRLGFARFGRREIQDERMFSKIQFAICVASGPIHGRSEVGPAFYS